MPRYRLTIAYEGTRYHGWQKQEPPVVDGGRAPGDQADADSHHEPDRHALRLQAEGDLAGLVAGTPGRAALLTVQAVVERAVRLAVREPAEVVGASRTDAGVHARGQTAAFTVTGDTRARGWPSDRGADSLRRAVNSRLPEDVLVVSACLTRDDFDPIADAVLKRYTYRVFTGLERPLFERNFVTHVRAELDVEAMRAACAHFVGTHDFAAFAAAGHGRQTTVRTVGASSVDRVAENTIEITFEGGGFLYNQVRIMAGTLVEVGRGRMPISRISDAIAARDRRLAGPTMPASGLCLEWVRYKDDLADPLASLAEPAASAPDGQSGT